MVCPSGIRNMVCNRWERGGSGKRSFIGSPYNLQHSLPFLTSPQDGFPPFCPAVYPPPPALAKQHFRSLSLASGEKVVKAGIAVARDYGKVGYFPVERCGEGAVEAREKHQLYLSHVPQLKECFSPLHCEKVSSQASTRPPMM